MLALNDDDNCTLKGALKFTQIESSVSRFFKGMVLKRTDIQDQNDFRLMIGQTKAPETMIQNRLKIWEVFLWS